MAKLIKARKAAPDNWQLLKADETLPASGNVIVPLAMWKAQRDALLALIAKQKARIAEGWIDPWLLASGANARPANLPPSTTPALSG